MVAEVQSGGDAISPDRLLRGLLGNGVLNSDQAGLLIQVWGQVSRDPELVSITSENLARMRQMLSSTLMAWAETRAPDADGARQVAESATHALLSAMFGFAVQITLDPANDPAALRESIVAGFAASHADQERPQDVDGPG